MKYFVLSCQGNQLALKCYNKKPKQLHGSSPKRQISLCPSFKVEKLSSCHSRALAVQLTAPSHQLCLSADNQGTVDKLVFLLQTQIRLRDNIRDNLVEVKTDPSEVFRRIGAKGANCMLHVSPWGLTLALKQSRVVLAQWPLKSVRYYESSGQGQFSIEAGMVAPMGEGVFQFHTLQGLDNRLYDTVDHYVINTLDRVKPNQRGTPEEIQDYLREFDCLHSLTVLTPAPLASNPEVSTLLQENWSSSSAGAGDVHPASPASSSSASDSVPSTPHSSVSSPVPSPSSPLRANNNANRPLPTPASPRPLPSPQQSPRSEQRRQSPYLQRQRDSPRQRGSPASLPRGEEGRVAGRPPPPPPRSGQHGSPSRPGPRGSPSQSARQDSVDGVAAFPHSAGPEPRRHSNPANVAFRVTHDSSVHPSAIRKQMSYDSNATGMADSNLSRHHHRHQHPAPNSPQSPIPSPLEGSAERSSCPVPSVSPRISGTDPVTGVEHKLESPVEDWLVSASCEDLSDHMRTVIFQQRQNFQSPALASEPPSAPPAQRATSHGNDSDPDYIPPPFENIMGFRSGMDLERSKARDRSQSFDVNSKMHKNSSVRNGAAGGGGSASPSIRQIRKMVSARSATKENLRKSLSNPNYLNLGSKEKLYQQRVQATRSLQHNRNDDAKLSSQAKHKSRSLASLLPSAIRRYLSRESLSSPSHHQHPSSSSTSPSPDMRHNTRRPTTTTTTMPTDGSEEDANVRRRHSARSLREMSIKGIHFTDQSRSFRKPKGYQRSKSADPNLRNHTVEDGSLPVPGGDGGSISGHRLSSGVESTAIEVGGDLGDKRSVRREDGGEGGGGQNCDGDAGAGRVAENGARVNGGLHSPDGDGKIRLPSRTTSQSSC
ncbi:uncharacterized protein LOC143289583 [Babylonia areolata]|uniref:uncharacterized protein LOC143289583 n=1 Tax=Babylonia areolata TaxID=304850 RepID=UPI003FD33C8F